jgi:hypothetical protein
MVNTNLDIFEMSNEESVSYFNRLGKLEKIRRTDGPSPATLPVDNEKRVSVTSSVGKPYSKSPESSNMWCNYCGKNNRNTADCRVITNFKQQKKVFFEAKSGNGKNSLSLLFLKI